MFRQDFLKALVTYHRFISFCLYCVGFVWFVLSLVKKYYMKQFSLFAWTHVALLVVVTQSYLIIKNIFEGLIWFIVPVSMIICNDIMAYVFGFFFGKTPLIKLSPKKTWEGFIGGGFSTVVFGVIVSCFFIFLINGDGDFMFVFRYLTWCVNIHILFVQFNIMKRLAWRWIANPAFSSNQQTIVFRRICLEF